MKLLNIFEKLYNHPNFNTILLWLIIISIIIFALILFLGLRDKNKEEREALKKEEEPEDITFTEIDEKDKIKEDVTFEMPTLTKNLVDFKRNIEEEIENEENFEVIPEVDEKEEDTKSIKVLDINEIEDTAILNQLFEEDIVAFEEDEKETKI